ncbi:ribonuclease HII [Candidatus Berkiella cookevillensis]|uniref:Ribonuclease HII n=1 Tax=Candidatus Berkiella cookevillensis TaxID=437022 RepID=A0A0Q9YHF2_9GAMM|nr:ribonuclease HII [Candidatus Berkiella cookevillensis]MCS5708370.1 ribonuclease HII [Candidatus Berkiella cookevillensis]
MIIAGCDEVGRGPLAGPVMAAAVILPASYDLPGLTDSKKLSEKKRERLFDAIKEQAVAWTVAEASVEEIDEINILQASLLAMKRAIETLSITPNKVLVDGNMCPKIQLDCEAIVGGDLTIPSISAASIIAKVTRDRLMLELDQKYPKYGLKANKGYPTKIHCVAIQEHGPCIIHRKSFAPIRDMIKQYEQS